MKASCTWILAALALAGCGTQTQTITVFPDEYVISANPSGGMYGGWVALSPSEDALAQEASARCPNGYRKVQEETGQGPFTTDYMRWTILCQTSRDAGVQAP